MRSLLHAFLAVMVVLLYGAVARAQPIALYFSDRPVTTPPTPEDELVLLKENVASLQTQLVAAQAGNQKDEDLKKRVELLQKQIETQQKMIELLVEHAKKQPLVGSPVEKLQTQADTLAARSRQAAQRDQELTRAVDNLTEHMDAEERNGPRLPATLKELFFPSRTNYTPLSIYGTLVGGYRYFPDKVGAGTFSFDAFEPRFLMQLNDNIMLVAEPEFRPDEIEVGYANANFIINDWLTLMAGRYLAPIGFYNERLKFSAIRKTPDFPFMERQVSLAGLSLNGLQARGATYLFDSPVKLEYVFYLANGLGIPGDGTFTDFARLDRLPGTTAEVNDAMAFGERVGLWIPELGLAGGFSMFFNRPYREKAGNDIDLWNVDLNYNKGNWDFRFEYAFMIQETRAFIGQDIHRRGFYAQIAYQPLDADNEFLRKVELVFQYSWGRFRGIDPLALDLSGVSPLRAPVGRDQYTFGINYNIYPMMIAKFHYQINQEQSIDLRDNVLLAQLAWGF